MTMPAGNYYVGDLCYVLHDAWDEFCDYYLERSQGECTLKDGRCFAWFHTEYGDGTYQDQYRRDYDVDAGLIGCILLKDIDMEYKSNFRNDNNPSLGHIVEFGAPFEVSTDGKGKLRFGHIVIGTGFEEEEYD